MSIIEILLHKNTLLALLVFVILSISIEIAGKKILLILHDNSATEWLFENIFIPLSRAISMMIFIIIAYPVLFGIHDAPAITQLLENGSHRASTLMNVIFIVPLVFSLIPVAGKIPAFILPVQAIAGSSLVFAWMQGANSSQTIHYLPQGYIILIIILLAIISHAIALWLSNHMAQTVNRHCHINDSQKIIYRFSILLIQLPVILVYTRGLGLQL